MTPLELGWVVGLFEGEGCISVHSNTYKSISLQLVSSDEDVVRRFAALVGVGTTVGPYQPNGNPKWKPVWRWACTHQHEAAGVITMLLPHLGARRAEKAQEALDAFNSRPRRNPTMKRHRETA